MKSFVDVLRSRAQQSSERVAFRFLQSGEADGPCELRTFGELDRRAQAIAAALAEHGASDEPVVLLFAPGLDFIDAFFGCLYAGCIAVPAWPPDPHRPKRSIARLKGIVADSAARFVLTEARIHALSDAIGESAPGLHWLVTPDVPTGRGDGFRAGAHRADRPAMLQYTSGATGAPKGVMLGHDNLLANQRLIAAAFGHDPERLAAHPGVFGVSWLPLFHDMGLIGHVLHPVWMGYESVLMAPGHFLQRPARWLEAISAFSAFTSGGPNFAYDLCLRHIDEATRGPLDLSRWRVAYCGAEPVRWSSRNAFLDWFEPCGLDRAAFLPTYGLAEATLLVTGRSEGSSGAGVVCLDGPALEDDRVSMAPPGRVGGRFVASCGRPQGDAQVEVVSLNTSEPVADDRIGEIRVCGSSVARGYWKQPERSAAVFSSGWLRTGDLGFVRDGELYVTGRLEDRIVVLGRNHYPADIEATVHKAHPAVRPGGCAAFSISTDEGEQLAIMCEVALNADRQAVANRIRQAVESEHGLGVGPLALIDPRKLPRTSSGKPRRLACRAELQSGPVPTPARNGAPKGAVRPWLSRRIARELGVGIEELDETTPFGSFGLGSLKLVEITNELAEHLDRELPATFFYDHPSIDAVGWALHPRPEEGDSDDAQIEPAEPIAVVGMACRFPGDVDDPEAYWQLLSDGRDAVGEVPPQRWDIDHWHDADPDAPGKMVSRRGGFLRQLDRFDPAFFEMSLGEAPTIDPQQRLLLEVCWEAFERAGLTRERLQGSDTGVYIGIPGTEYGYHVMADEKEINAYSLLGTAHSAVAGRLSYWLGLQGPNFPVDTACSSSLLSVHLACQGLRARECDRAVAAGVNVMLEPAATVYFTKLGALSPQGRCQAFDAAADGYVRGEGCGAVVLMRLSDALAQGQPVLAVIRGSAVNQDGRSSGFTAPSGRQQQAVVRRALRVANRGADDLDYVEAHGTGTPIGDPIEVNALGGVFDPGRERPLWIGSVKTNIGHLEGAAGIASLIKAVLMLQHRRMPASLHFRAPNPRVDWDSLPIRVVTEARDFEDRGRPITIGVNAFGFSGTNAHVVLEEWPSRGPTPDVQTPVRGPWLLPISAKGRDAVAAWAGKLRHQLEGSTDADMPALAAALAHRRTHWTHRAGVVANGIDDAMAGLARLDIARAPRKRGKVAFVFTGQGSQYPEMGRGLYERNPVFRRALDACAAALDPELLDVMFAPPGSELAARLDQTAYTQAALFAVEVALAEVWASYGVQPDCVLGHSVGEIAAAHVAGALSLPSAARLVTARGRAMQAQPGGTMAVVAADEATTRRLIGDLSNHVCVAAANGPAQTVVSGEAAATADLLARLEDRGIAVVPLTVSHAFHSAMMEPAQVLLRAQISELEFSEPQIDFISTVADADGVEGADYWVDQLRAPVRFMDAIRAAVASGVTTLIEIGPAPILCGLATACLPNDTKVALVPSLRRGRDDVSSLLSAVGAAWTAGVAPDFSAVNGAYAGPPFPLPTYAFQRERFWVRDVAGDDGGVARVAGPTGRYALSGAPLRLPGKEQHRLLMVGLHHQPYLRDHVVHGHVVVPGAFWLSTMLAIGAETLSAAGAQLTDVEFLRPLIVDDDFQLHVVIDDTGRFRMDTTRDGDFTTHVTGTLSAVADRPQTTARLNGARDRCERVLDVDGLYGQLSAMSIELGPAWRWTKQLQAGAGEALSRLEAPPNVQANQAPLHPAQLDNVFATGLVSLADEERARTTPVLPFCVEAVRWYGGDVGACWAHGSIRDSEDGHAVFDLKVFDQAGALGVELEGFHARSAPRQVFMALAGATARDPLWRLDWEPAAVADEPDADVEQPALWCPPEDGPDAAERTTNDIIAFAREVAAMPTPPRHVTLASCGATADVVWAVGRVWRNELAGTPTTVRLLAGSREDVATALTRWPSAPANWQLRLGSEGALVPRLKRVVSEGAAFPPLAGGTTIVTGGLGHLGLHLAAALVNQHDATRLLLLGRSSPGPEALEAIDALRNAGAVVDHVQVDVADRPSLGSVMSQAAEDAEWITVVHAAGAVDDAPLADQSPERVARAFRAKVRGAYNLHDLTSGMPVRAFVCISSIAPLLGSPGQANYAAANAAVEALCRKRRDDGLAAHAVALGPVAGGGMTASLSAGQRRRMEQQGVRMLEPEVAAALLVDALTGSEPVCIVAELDPAVISGARARPATAGWLDELTGLEVGERELRLRDRLTDEVAAVLGVADPTELPSTEPLRSLGLDSLMAAELRATLNNALGVTLPLAALFDHPTINALAAHLATELGDSCHRDASLQETAAETSIEVPYPVTSGQRRLWLLNRMSDSPDRYHVHFELRISGVLPITTVRRALTVLIARHEVLRTVFVPGDGDPKQVVLAPYEPALPAADLIVLAPAQRAERLAKLTEELTTAPFDLAREPAIRFAWITVAKDTHRLLVTQHHIITDGLSVALLVRELGAIHGALHAGLSPRNTPTGRRFTEVAHLEAEAQTSSHMAYWRDALAGLPPLVLAPSRPRRTGWDARGGLIALDLGSAGARLLELAGQMDVTPFMAVQSLLTTLLHRVSRQEDFAIGTVVGGRCAADRETLGFFVNTVVLRQSFCDTPTFRDVLERTRALTAAALSHADVPFDDVVRHCRTAHRPGRNPLFDVCLVQETPVPASTSAGGLTIETSMSSLGGSVAGTAKFDLALVFELAGGTVRGHLAYADDAVGRPLAQRFAERLTTLADSATRAPDQAVASLDFIGQAEREELDELERPTPPAPTLGETLHGAFAAREAEAPDAIAIRVSDRTITRRDLRARARAIAARIASDGVPGGECVAVLLPRSADLIAAIIGVLEAGCALVPLAPDLPPLRLRDQLAETEARVCITTSELAPMLDQHETRLINVDELGRSSLLEAPARPQSELAYVLFTSGTSGRPRGIQVTHQGLMNVVSWKCAAVPPQAGDRLLLATSVAFDSALGQIGWALAGGAELVLASPGAERDPEAISVALRTHRITVFKAVPSQLEALLLVGGLDGCDALRILISSGEPLSASLAARLLDATSAELANFYGPAETTITATAHFVSRSAPPDSAIPIGRPIGGMAASVVDPDGRRAPRGCVGELVLSGLGVTDPGDCGYRTGDRARWSDDGDLEFIGRTDRQVKLGGHRIALEEVERVMSTAAGIRSCAVRMQRGRLVAYVEGAEVGIDDVQRAAEQSLPRAAIPTQVHQVEALPRLPSGKVDYQALAGTPSGPAAALPAAGPVTATEHVLATLWGQALEVDHVGLDDDFFRLGGHSLLAVRVMVETRRRLGGPITIGDLFHYPTVRRLAAHIDAGSPSSDHSCSRDRDALYRRVRLPTDLVIVDGPSVPPEQCSRPLLTGATGLLGAHILAELASDRSTEVHCLVRASDPTQGLARIRDGLVRQGVWSEAAGALIRPVCGDLGKRRFGLTPQAWSSLAASVDQVIHCGAQVSHAQRFDALQDVNVGGTMEVLRLACHERLRPMVFVSTLGVFGDLSEPCLESNPSAVQPPARSGYAQTKWLAEQLLWRAADRGARVCVVRPGLVVGHSKTGRIDAPDHWLLLLLDAIMTLGAVPEASRWPSLTLMPVDLAGRAIARLSRMTDALGRAVHLDHPQPVEVDMVRRSLSAAGLDVQSRPYAQWHEQLAGADLPHLERLLAVLPPVDTETPGRRVIDRKNVTALLGDVLGALPSAEDQIRRLIADRAQTLRRDA